MRSYLTFIVHIPQSFPFITRVIYIVMTIPIETKFKKGGHHSSVVLSATTILQPRDQIPSTPSTLLIQFKLFKIASAFNVGMIIGPK